MRKGNIVKRFQIHWTSVNPFFKKKSKLQDFQIAPLDQTTLRDSVLNTDLLNFLWRENHK